MSRVPFELDHQFLLQWLLSQNKTERTVNEVRVWVVMRRKLMRESKSRKISLILLTSVTSEGYKCCVEDLLILFFRGKCVSGAFGEEHNTTNADLIHGWTLY